MQLLIQNQAELNHPSHAGGERFFGSSAASAWQLPGSAVQGQQSCSITDLEQGMALAGTWLCSPLSLMAPCRNLAQLTVPQLSSFF